MKVKDLEIKTSSTSTKPVLKINLDNGEILTMSPHDNALYIAEANNEINILSYVDDCESKPLNILVLRILECLFDALNNKNCGGTTTDYSINTNDVYLYSIALYDYIQGN